MFLCFEFLCFDAFLGLLKSLFIIPHTSFFIDPINLCRTFLPIEFIKIPVSNFQVIKAFYSKNFFFENYKLKFFLSLKGG